MSVVPGHAAARCAAAASTAPQLADALREACATATAALGAVPDVAVAFVSAAYGAGIRGGLEGLADLVGTAAVIATSAEGVLAGAREYEDTPAVAVWLARLPGARVVPVALDYRSTPDGGMFSGWPAALDADWPAGAALLLLADPFTFPVDGLVRRLEEDHPDVCVVGGMASGGSRPGGNVLAAGAATFDAGAVGLVVGGAARIRPLVSQGCRPIGRPLVVTRAQENLLVELGGRPALERLRELYDELDPADRDLVKSSLHVGRAASEYRDRFGPGDFLVRNVVGADPDSGVIAVADVIRTGQTVQFHVRDARSATEDLRRLLEAAPPAAGALVFTCNGRGTRLFAAPDHDARLVQECLGPLPTAGFFAQGEIGPVAGRTFLHGFTASIALVEAAG